VIPESYFIKQLMCLTDMQLTESSVQTFLQITEKLMHPKLHTAYATVHSWVTIIVCTKIVNMSLKPWLIFVHIYLCVPSFSQQKPDINEKVLYSTCKTPRQL